MLRCTLSGLIPLMQSNKYSGYTEAFYNDNTTNFESIIKHKSYYIIRKLPVSLAEKLFLPELPSLVATQKKNGMWKIKDTERITYDILSALKHMDMNPNENFKYSPLEYLADKYDFYSLLIKTRIYDSPSEKDHAEIAKLVSHIKGNQKDNGSWDDTVIGTVVNIENLLDLGVCQEDTAILHGIEFLFENQNTELEGIHTTGPYGLTANNIFTTKNRSMEFETADRVKQEWMPRNVCFKTLAIITNTVCVSLLVRLGMENDTRVISALDSIYQLYDKYGGLCATNIKKPFIK